MRWLAPCLGGALLAGVLCGLLWSGISGLFEPRISPLPPVHRLAAGFDTVIIDPGHGGNDSGASAHGLQEKKISLDLAYRLSTELRNLGLTAVLTRQDDTYLSLPDRVRFAQAVPAAIFVSLHCNYASNANASGFDIYRAESKNVTVPTVVQTSAGWEPLAVQEEQLADAINNSLIGGCRSNHHETRTANFFVLRNLDMPALLIECGFLTNPEDARALASPAFRTRLAGAIAKGIAAYRSTVSSGPVQDLTKAGDHSGQGGNAL